MAFLELINLRKTYGPVIAVDAVDLAVEQGEFVSLLGPSGCGKTTTLRMIAGFEEPTAGRILVNGADITTQRPNQRHIGMVFQSYALFPNLTVAENIGFGLKVARRPAAEIRQRVAEMLELIKLPDLSNRYPYQLSGGQQQRVALARALAIRPQLLLLDEPLSALDAKIRIALRNEIRAIQRQLGITTIYVTHDQEEALSLSDRVVVMNNGRIEQVGTPFEVYNFPTTRFVASFVGTLNLLPAEVVDPGQGLVRVGGQTVAAAHALGDVRAGDEVMLALRPELLSLEDPAALDNRLAGEVANVSFLGSIVRVEVRIGDQERPAAQRPVLLVDTFNNPHLALPAPGSAVEVGFPKEACLVLDHAGRSH
ncbi:MAG TPA: ABC transporter ATP-binding protein [Caldilineaceae bacterium]|nr:ABC transporter ATP-binding protein [Caldilineaceae bacterium]